MVISDYSCALRALLADQSCRRARLMDIKQDAVQPEAFAGEWPQHMVLLRVTRRLIKEGQLSLCSLFSHCFTGGLNG